MCLRSHGLSLPCQYTFIVSVVRRTRLASLSVNPPTPSQLTIRIDECLVQRDLEFIHLLSEHSTFYHFQIQTHVSCHSTVMSPRTSNEILLSNVSTVSTGSFCSPKPPITSTCTQYFGELQGVRSVLSRDCLLIVSNTIVCCTCVCKKSLSPVLCLLLSLIGVILSPSTTTELAFVTSSERKFVCDLNTSSRQGCERQKR